VFSSFSRLCLVASFTGVISGQTVAVPFYLPANPDYTIVDSVLDSIGFTLNKSLTTCDQGHFAAKASFLDTEGEAMEWHDFGKLEGPGWAANAIGGAYEIYRWGKFLGRTDWQATALGILDHVLDHGFLDYESGFIKGYRNVSTDEFVLNYQNNSEWFCPGAMAKNGFQLLLFADELEGDSRSDRMRRVSVLCAEWLEKNLAPVPNGWFARRCDSSGKVYTGMPGGGEDPFWQTSGDSLFIIQHRIGLTSRGLADYRDAIEEKIRVFMDAGGYYASSNHDTYDKRENVVYAVAFRTLLQAAKLLDNREIRKFAFDRSLEGLDRFKIREDRNGVKTQGLLYMEKSWDTAYLWENAESALAYFEAAAEVRDSSPEVASQFELDGLTILRACAKHHYGPHGFLTEGVDWNNHVGQEHHIGGAEFGAIRYTEPFLNNQHIAEPTLYYLEHLAETQTQTGKREWRDCENTLLLSLPALAAR
jgi:hypothetical protein